MSIVVFSNGRPEYAKGADGAVVRILFDDEFNDESEPLKRHELTDEARFETNGAVAHSYGPGVTMVEVISLAALKSRFRNEEIDKAIDVAASCISSVDNRGVLTCVSGNCNGNCKQEWFLSFCWCSCG
jgi:hypothetical protein